MNKKYVESELSPILDYFHDKENYIFFQDDEKIKLDIRYPKKVVTNEQGKTHTIYDFILHLGFVKYQEKELLLSHYSGTRGAFTTAEYSANYSFSHCSPGASDNLRFCFGNGPIVSVINSLQSCNFFNITNETKKLFEKFLILFGAYLEVESLEGGPYIKMDKISSSQVIGYFVGADIDFFRDFLQNKIEPDSLNLIKRDDSFIVKFTPAFMGDIEKYAKETSRGLVYIDGNGDEKTFSGSSYSKRDFFDTCYTFGGKSYRQKVIKTEDRKEENLVLSNRLINTLESNLSENMDGFLYNNYLKKIFLENELK